MKGLKTGDYTILGMEDHISVERKSLEDFISCVGGERERFDREIERLKEFPVKAIIVEATLHDLLRGEWRSQVTINAVLGSYIGWQCHGIPIILAGDKCHDFIEWFLTIAAKRRMKELKQEKKDVRVDEVKRQEHCSL